jgi:hypothetical protein
MQVERYMGMRKEENNVSDIHEQVLDRHRPLWQSALEQRKVLHHAAARRYARAKLYGALERRRPSQRLRLVAEVRGG